MDQGGSAATEKERLQHLMMGEVDQELSTNERKELETALERHPAMRHELESFKRLKEVTDTMSPLKPPGETWDTYWEDVYRRFERGIGWVLISIATIVLGTWGLWNVVRGLIEDSSIPGFIRWSLLALLAGFVILFVSVVRERLFMGKRDPYKDVVR